MATVVLQYVGAAVGTFLGGPVGGILGRAIGAVAGNIFDQTLFGPGTRRIQGPRLTDTRVMASSEGSAIPRLWGRMRISGQVIWATNLEEVVTTDTDKGSGKGGPKTKTTTYSYFANCAIALCEGEIDRIGRVWADGKPFDISGLTWRLYRGTETQAPDSLIVAKEGADNAPAYRGTAYVVFERLPLENFGNRLPQLSFEVFRGAGGAEGKVRAVNIIPGSTEFGYDTKIVTSKPAEGETTSENAHAAAETSDWSVSIDELTATCGNLEAASLVVAWFGNDLRCGELQLKPGVENITKVTSPDAWSVAGLARGAAHVVSTGDGKPAYGGTPSDASVARALQDLKARGLATVFYPFILMDIPPGNSLPDPYGGGSQAAHPWRGRVTCDPAPGRPGSADKTAACATQVQNLVGAAQPGHFGGSGATVTYSGPAEWSYRRMVLHYAKLCALAGGVDAFLIGSELRGLTTLRSGPSIYPFVAALVALAADVKAMLPDAKVSYAADWSEYFGHQPGDGSGDVRFHLDPLWSSADIGFVGIDNYMPLTDWRDGNQHTDRLAGTRSIYDLDYLKAGIAGGEGFDWYYAGEAARTAQTRTAITDGAYGKPWVFRHKDLKSWWLNAHYDRPGGVEAAAPTGWVPQSKPFWFTEAGCAAIDKGTNQPNAFVDAKSSESLLPYFSSGHRDDFLQNRFVTAIGEYWSAAGGGNPVSAVYGAPMLDAARLFLWAWDARPFPYFPALDDVWADGPNYSFGHWLNGRIGAVPLARLIAEICDAYGFTAYDVSEVEGLADGFVIERPMAARDALEGLLAAFAIDAIESGGKLKFRMRRKDAAATIVHDELAETDAQTPLFALTRAQETELPAAVKLVYVETAAEYRLASVEARRLRGSSAREAGLQLPCAIGQATAQARADVVLQESWAGRETIDFALPPGRIDLEPGDVVEIELGSAMRPVRIEQVTDGALRRLRARSYEAAVFDPPDAPQRGFTLRAATVLGQPDVAILDIPVIVPGVPSHAPWFAASAKPWPGKLAAYKQRSATSYAFNRMIEAQATKGLLLDALPAGPLYVLDRAASVSVALAAGGLSSVSMGELLAGANAAAIGDPVTGWEVLQFATANLIATGTYRIGSLLRGQSGSEPEMLPARPAGSRFVLLNDAVVQQQLLLAEAGLELTWRIGPAAYDYGHSSYLQLTHQGRMLALRPLSPCQLRAGRDGGDVVFTWIRRTRIDGDSWELSEVPLGEDGESYIAEIIDGSTVKRTVQTATPAFRYTAAQIAADFGGSPSSFTLRIAQVSATYGRGANLQRTINV